MGNGAADGGTGAVSVYNTIEDESMPRTFKAPVARLALSSFLRRYLPALPKLPLLPG